MAKRRKRKAVPAMALPTPAPDGAGRDWIWALVLIGAVIAAYLPVWRAGFVWDDDKVVTENPCMIGLGGLVKIWTTSAADICPLTLTTFWIEHAIWGNAALPYHVINVLMQGWCAVLLWRVLRALRLPGAWLGAAIWALHPVQVESVAWITEMKNTESGILYLLTILFFLRSLDEASWKNYAWSLLFAALAMASKSSTLVLPLVLILAAWWMEGRWSWRNVWKVAPVFGMAAITGAVSIWTQSLRGADDPIWARSWPERIAGAGDAVWFYLGKLAWPRTLLTIYPRWQIDGSSWISYLPLLTVIVLLGIFLLWRASWARSYFFAGSYFIAALLPVLGFANLSFFSDSFVADHFQYLASMGPLALAGAGLKCAADFIFETKSPWPSILAGVLLAIMGAGTFHQATFYRDPESLWSHTLAYNPGSWAAHNDLATALFRQGQVDASMAEDERGIALNPHDAQAYNNLAIAYAQKGRFDDAIAAMEKTGQVDPGYPDARWNLASVHNNYGVALLQQGRIDDAIRQHEIALQIDPDLADAYNDLGTALLRKGRVDDAQAAFEKALQLKPDYPEAHFDLGLVYARKGRLEESAAQFQAALKLRPDLAPAQQDLDQVEAALRRRTN